MTVTVNTVDMLAVCAEAKSQLTTNLLLIIG